MGRRTSLLLVIGLIAAVGLAGCGGEDEGSPMPLEPSPPAHSALTLSDLVGRWDVTEIRRAGGDTVKTRNAPFLAVTASGRASGYDAVNSWGGRLEVAGSAVSVTDAVSTLIGLTDDAPPVLTDTQKAFGVLLSGRPVRARLDGDRLTLVCGGLELVASRARN